MCFQHTPSPFLIRWPLLLAFILNIGAIKEYHLGVGDRERDVSGENWSDTKSRTCRGYCSSVGKLLLYIKSCTNLSARRRCSVILLVLRARLSKSESELYSNVALARERFRLIQSPPRNGSATLALGLKYLRKF